VAEEEKGKSANLHNELQYTKMELTKASDEVKASQAKIAAAKKVEQ